MNQKSKIAVVLDFDRTLFDTDTFKLDLAKSVKKFGVSDELFFKLYKKSITENADGVHSYNLQKHVGLMGDKVANLSPIKVRRGLLKIIANSRKYLYPETIKFLQQLRKEKFYLILLTHGHQAFQQKKVNGTGIVKYFNKLVILDGEVKAPRFKQYLSKFSKVWFISDHIGELVTIKATCPKVKLILKLGGYSTAQAARAANIVKEKRLLKIFKYIKNQIKKRGNNEH